jgi:heme A synthase
MLTAYFIALDRNAPAWLVGAGRDTGLNPDRAFTLIARAGAVVIFALVLTGGATSTSGAALACDQWPVCIRDAFIPERTSRYTWINISHRAAALIAAGTVAFVLYQALRRPVARAAKRLAVGAAAIIAVQILLGAAYVWTAGSSWLSAAHLAMATLLSATMLGLALVAHRPTEPEWRPIGPRTPAATSESQGRQDGLVDERPR